MKHIFGVLLVFVTICAQPLASSARELGEYTLEQKVEASDMIFVGNVLAIERPQRATEGVKAFAVVSVTEWIKGVGPSKELKFVVQGSISEANPSCCSVGTDYLFFARDGVQVLTLEKGAIGGKMDLQGEFISPSNGKFSTYPVASGKVSGWFGAVGKEEKPIPTVRKEICEAARRISRKQ